jgi:hypothetical protein
MVLIVTGDDGTDPTFGAGHTFLTPWSNAVVVRPARLDFTITGEAPVSALKGGANDLRREDRGRDRHHHGD